MVQRKVPSKLGSQADYVKSEKRLGNPKLSSSQHQDGKARGADMKKKMKKSRYIKLSDLETLKASPSKQSFSQPGKPPPLHIPTTTAISPQKQQHLIRTNDGSPNYMKPTSSSHAKKELFPVSLRNSQTSASDCKNQLQKASSNSKAGSVSGKKPAKTLTRSSSLKLVRTLTKTPSFKPSRACPRKSSTVALCADINAQRATCSSTLKDSKIPPYLILNPGATESEGTSAMKVCPYTYCSLNGHRHAPLPSLKTFLSARRRILKTQKSMKLEALSPRRLKLPCEPKKDSDIDRKNVFDGKLAYEEADTGIPTIPPLVQDIDMDFFIEIYAKKNEDEIGKMDSTKELEDQEDVKSIIEESSMAAQGDDDIELVIASVSDGSPKSEIDFVEDFKKYFDEVSIEADTNESFLLEQKADYVDETHSPIWSGEKISMGSYCIEMDGSNSEATDKEWEEEQSCASELEDDFGSSVLTEENDSKFESLSESSHDISVMWLDDIVSIYYKDILAEESTYYEAQPHGMVRDLLGTNESVETQESSKVSNSVSCKQSCLTEEVFQELTDAEENGGANETYKDTTVFSSNFTEQTLEEPEERDEENQEKNNVPEAENLMTVTSLELGYDVPEALDEEQEDMSLQEDASKGCYELNQVETDEERKLEMENDETCQEVAANHFTPEKEPLTAETGDKMEKEDEDFDKQLMENNGYDLSQDCCEAAKVESSQAQKTSEPCEVDENSEAENSSLDTNDGSINKELMEKDNELQSSSNNWKGAIRRNRAVQDEEELKKFNPREPNFLPLVPDPEAEKVDLKHQMIDERKNAEEWMLDYALRQAVTKLAPARKRKVALLVEAFETVNSVPKCETHMRNKQAFAHARPIQACN